MVYRGDLSLPAPRRAGGGGWVVRVGWQKEGPLLEGCGKQYLLEIKTNLLLVPKVGRGGQILWYTEVTFHFRRRGGRAAAGG